GHRTDFPYADYGALLAQAAAVDATAVVPGANGAAHVRAHRWMDRFVFPVPERRFLRDLAALQPSTRPLPLRVGGRYRVTPGEVVLDQAAVALVELESPEPEPEPEPEPRSYRPLVMPRLADPNPAGHDEATMRAHVQAFIHHELAEGLTRAWPGMHTTAPLRCAVEVIFPHAHDVFTLEVGPGGTRVYPDLDDDWDLLNVVTGSMFYEVLRAQRHWGDVLLSGSLRAVTRAYAIDAKGLHRARIGEIFLYYGLSYEEAVERAVRHEVRTLIEAAPPAP
ncbi:MAG: hypothetical protein KDK70_34730, partial [Myxococcales bacterium]|nr:hypothetical protein [Myxococcales bacterium]